MSSTRRSSRRWCLRSSTILAPTTMPSSWPLRAWAFDLTPSLDAGLMAATLAWAHGSTLATAIDATPIQAGDFVRWMRQVMDCLGQIASASSSGELARKAEAAKDRIGRGIVAWSTI